MPTVKGTTAVVVQHAEAFERLLDVAARVDAEEGIRQGLEDAKEGFGPRRNFSMNSKQSATSFVNVQIGVDTY